MKRIVLAEIVGRTDDDIVLRVLPANWLDAHYLDQSDIRSEPFEKLEDLKFTEDGVGGLYLYTEDEMKNKLLDLTKRAKKRIPFNADGTVQYVVAEKDFDGFLLNQHLKNFYTDDEAYRYVQSLNEGCTSPWRYTMARKGY